MHSLSDRPRRPYDARRRAFALLLALLPALGAAAQGQPVPVPLDADTPLVLTLDEAVQIALVSNYAVRGDRLSIENAEAQVREAWGQVLPQVDASASYTRNLKSANPFAGSAAGGLFGSLGFVDWLAFNERARTDEDPGTVPIAFPEFQDRQAQGLREAGISLGGSDNPFAVENQFQNGLTVTQTLFNGSAFAAISGAERLKDINRKGLARQEQLIVDEVRRSFYQALLAQAQAGVVESSVGRTAATLSETARRVAQGVAPKFQRTSAEVTLANLETQLVQVQTQAATALDQLKFTLGIPVAQPVRLRGSLAVDEADLYRQVSVAGAYAAATERRPDLDQARLAVELREIDRRITRAEFLPRLSAFANLSYSGSVPDDRSFTVADPDDPFSFTRRDNTFFSESYWQPSVNVGMTLTWNLFNGFQTSARAQQRQIAVEQARLDYARLEQGVRLEVETALRSLRAAYQQILSQEQNVARAEENYRMASVRLREGVATPLEERDASDQLDQSRLNYLQAVHDYLVARSAYETALGLSPTRPADANLTLNQ